MAGGEILIICSMAWIIIWSFIGMRNGSSHPKWLEKMGDLAKKGELHNFWSTYDGFMMKKTGHAHANCVACVSFLVGLTMKIDMIGYSEMFLTILAIWMFAGVILEGIGTRLRIIPLSAVGSILFLTALIASFVGLFV